MKAKRLEYQLCTPWYVRGTPAADPENPHRPVVQKYAVLDWVPGLLADPTSSVGFDKDDTWNYYVPAVAPAVGKQPVRTEQRALFQPVQGLAYAVLIELCLAGPQFAPAGLARDIAVRFVVRRERVAIPPPPIPPPPNPPPPPYRTLGRKILRSWNSDPATSVDLVTDADLQDLLSAPAFVPTGFADEYKVLLEKLPAGRQAQALTGGPDGPWAWTPIDVSDKAFALVANEREYPMWRVLPAADAKGDDKQRSLWFGAAPTDGAFLPPAPADFRKADHRWTCTLTCVAHQGPPPDMPQCPPRTFLSASCREFRVGPGGMVRGATPIPA